MGASEGVRREWLRRVEAEDRSVALTQHLGHWLIQIAAPPDLVTAALAIVADKMAHAELSLNLPRFSATAANVAVVAERPTPGHWGDGRLVDLLADMQECLRGGSS
jgi:hypothetical protein